MNSDFSPFSCPAPLLVTGTGAQLLHSPAHSFSLKPALLARQCWPRGPARPWRRRCLPDKRGKPLTGVGAVALLGAITLRDEDQHAILGHAPATELDEALKNIGGKRGRARRVEAKLHGGRHLVDVLTAGTRRKHEALLDFLLGDFDLRCNPDACHAPRFRRGSGAAHLVFGEALLLFHDKTRQLALQPVELGLARIARARKLDLQIALHRARAVSQHGDPAA